MDRLETHHALLLPVITAWGGVVVKSIGDAFMLTFDSPTDAMHCALCLQHTLKQYNRTSPEQQNIHIKISVNCGEVTLTDTDVFGDPVNVAAKIEKAAKADETLFTEAVYLSMNQSEVPCEHAGHFAARGEEGAAIELYRLRMDEGNSQYQRVLTENSERLVNSRNTRQNRVPANALKHLVFAHYGKLLWAGAVVAVGTASSLIAIQNPIGDSATVTVTDTANANNTPNNAPVSGSVQGTADNANRSDSVHPNASDDTLVWARSIIKDNTSLKDENKTVIERLTSEFGSKIGQNPELQSILLAAMSSRVYWEARENSFNSAGQLIAQYREKYPWTKNRNWLEREQHLGGLYNLNRDQWRSPWNNQWVDSMNQLLSFAAGDADFSWRVAIEISAINAIHNKIAAPQEQELVRQAIELKPRLLDTERERLLAFNKSWLEIEQSSDSFARQLASRQLFNGMQPWLVAGVWANNRHRNPPEPNIARRQNSLAVLADNDELGALGNVARYIQDNTPVFMRATETVKWGDGTTRTMVYLTDQQIQRVLQQPMSDSEKTAVQQLLDKLLADIQANEGPWGGNNDARQAAQTMKATLSAR